MKINHYLALLLLLAVGAAIMLVITTTNIQAPRAGGVSISSFEAFDTYATSSVGNVTSATANLSANAARVYLRLCTTAAEPIYWSNTSTSLVVGKGERLDAYGQTTSTHPCMTYSGYKGPVYTIAAATTTLLITEAY